MLTELEERIAALEAVRDQMVRVGKVVTSYPERGTVRIDVPDSDELTSYELPVLFKKTMDDKDYQMPDIGEHVLAIFLPYGLEQGFILGAFYSKADEVPVMSQDKFHKLFKDGTWLEYDRATHALTGVIKGSLDMRVDTTAVVDVGGDLTAKSGGNALLEAAIELRLKAPNVIIEGNLTTYGYGGGDGLNVVNGDWWTAGSIHSQTNITAGGTIIDASGNSPHHDH